LDVIVNDRVLKKQIDHVGITKEEITLNKRLLANMLSSEADSPGRKFTNCLPVVERK
jgi:hypothetical protein